MEKEDLKRAAEALASGEAALRQAWSRAQQPDAGPAAQRELEERRRERAALLAEANRIRASIDRLAGKQYWWDVPFDERRPPLGGPAFPEGVYSERDELIQEGGALVGRKNVLPGGGILSFYQLSWTPLYMDRAEMKAHLSDQMERRSVYQASAQVIRPRGPAEPAPGPAEGDLDRLAAETRRQMDAIESDLQQRLERHNDFWDLMERLGHESVFTNRERLLMGQMNSMDYLREDMSRSMLQSQMEQKAREEQSKLEYRLQQARNRRNAARLQRLRDGTRHTGQSLIRLTPAADVVYRGETLVAIYLPRDGQPVWEVGGVDPLRLEGPVSRMRELGYERPDRLPLFCHLIRAYSPAMKPYSVLAARPDGLTNEEWRAWAELRWSYTLWSRDRK